MKSWYEIYKDRMNQEYANHIETKYKPFIDQILSELDQPKVHTSNLIEIGCGAGNITSAIRNSEKGDWFNYLLIDKCPKMLGLAIQNNPSHICKFQCTDVVRNNYGSFSNHQFTVVHSHGLLEHFDDGQVLEIVNQARMVSRTQLHYVPSYRYQIPSRGDERLLTKDQWVQIISRDPRVLVEAEYFNDDFDIILRITRRD